MLHKPVFRGCLLLLSLLLVAPAARAAARSSAARGEAIAADQAQPYSAQIAKRARKANKSKVKRAQRKARRARKARAARRGGKASRTPRETPELVDPTAPAPIVTTRRAPARVDFDDRLIQGQTNKSGAIYIFERKSSELHSMVRRRTSFRDEILRTLE